MPHRLMRFLSWRSLCLLVLLPSLSGAAPNAEAQQTPPHRVLPNENIYELPSAIAPVPVLRVDSLGKGSVPLEGPWQFHTGDDPAWAEPTLDDSRWDRITADQPWGAQPGFENYTGYAWYRRHISLNPAAGVEPDFALLIGHVDDAYEIYWNGQPIGSNGKMPPKPVWYNDQPAQTFALNLASNSPTLPGEANVLAVRVWKAPLFSYDSGQQGGFQSPPEIGSPDVIAAHKAALDYRWLRSRQFSFALDCLYALVALLCLLAWLRDRQQWLLFWMAGFSIAPLAVLLLDGLRIPWPFAISLGLQQPMYSIEDISLWFTLLWILELQAVPNTHRFSLHRITILLAVVNLSSTVLDGLVAMFGWTSSWSGQTQLWDGLLTAVLTVTEIWPLILVGVAAKRLLATRKRVDPARWMVAITAFLTVMMSVLQVSLSQGSRFTHWTISERISAPIFVLNGNPIAPYTLFRTLLVFALLYAVYRYYADLRLRRSSLERELQSARELQQVLIPETPPTIPGFSLTGAYRPAQEVGGDFFQIIPLEDGDTLVLLGDVSGKGLGAAMAVALIVGAVRALSRVFSSPALLLVELNQSLYGRLQGGFATCIALRLGADGRCDLASAGHPSPFLNGHELTLPGALPLGLTPACAYQESTLELSAGDHLALYTDGLLEARNAAGELLSFDRLRALFAGKPTAEQATEVAVNFGQDDDITVLTLIRRPPGFVEAYDPMRAENQTIRLYPAP